MITVDTHKGNKIPLSEWELSLLFIFIISIVLPPAPQAISTTLVAFWFIYRRGWQTLFSDQNSQLRLRLLKIIGLGIGLSTLCHIIGLIAQYTSSNSDFFTIFRGYFRLIGKQGIWGIFMIMALHYAKIRGFTLQTLNRALILAITLLFLYMLAQRYWGIDWVHGFSAKIPDNRFSSGVYRAAGMMSHPLSFSYNAALLSLIFLGYLYYSPTTKQQQMIWGLCGILTFFTLLLSNSRWPTIICLFLGLFLVFVKNKTIFFKKKFLAVVLLLGTVTIFATKDRVSEILVGSGSIQDRVPRLVFWEVHWHIFKEHPIIGIGYVGKEVPTVDQYNKLGYNSIERKYAAHNIFLQTLADSGIVGFLGLASLLGCLTFSSMMLFRRVGNPLLLVITAFTMLGGLMQNNLRDSEYLFALWLAIGISTIMDWDKSIAARGKVKDL